MPVRYMQGSSTQAAASPATAARSATLEAGEHVMLGQGRAGSKAMEGAAPVAPELRKSQPTVYCRKQMLGEQAANMFPGLGSLNRQREDEEAAGKEEAATAWSCIPRGKEINKDFRHAEN